MKPISEMEKKESNCRKLTEDCRYPKNRDCCRNGGFDKNCLCDLDEMVTEYRMMFMDGKDSNLSVLSTFTDFICGGANIKEAPHADRYCKNSHQYRMTRDTIHEAHGKLTAAGLDRYDSFADIHAAVTDVASTIKKIRTARHLRLYRTLRLKPGYTARRRVPSRRCGDRRKGA